MTPEIIQRLLEARGISAADLDGFLHPSLKNLPRPDTLPKVSEAVETILAAVKDRRRIVVFGDYDCDGVCATAILVRALEAVTGEVGQVAAFLPRRLTEGYGMSAASVARMLAEHPDVGLVVTVDNGINSIDEVAQLKARGIAVVVTDHHLPGLESETADGAGRPQLPAADALVNPKVAAPPEHADLCGAGVAFVLANALVTKARERGVCATCESVSAPMLVLAGLATVTDVMPLKGQNRILVAEALRRFHAAAPVGLRELYLRASRAASPALKCRDFGFLLGPRINAAGRLEPDSGASAIRLVLSRDREEARAFAQKVDLLNADRKSLEGRMLAKALEQIVPGADAQVIEISGGHQGVAGIVAARVMDQLAPKVPVCVVVDGLGSARAPEGYNVRDALGFAASELERFGGHALAAGFTVRAGALEAFREQFAAACRLQAQNLSTASADERVDAWVEPGDLTLELAEWLERLEPFGEGNREPLFGLRNVVVRELRQLRSADSERRHYAMSVAGLRAVWWNCADQIAALQPRDGAVGPCDLTFYVGISDYGETHLELRVESLRLSGAGADGRP